jgi:hypothetical protein
VPQGRATLELASFGNSLRYNSPDMSGEPAEQWLLRANGHLQQQLMRARARRSQARAKWRTGHSTVHVRCATEHPGGPSSQSSNGRNLSAFRDRGVPKPTSECAACPSPDGSSAWASAKGGEARWPETGVREVEVPRPSCSSRA